VTGSKDKSNAAHRGTSRFAAVDPDTHKYTNQLTLAKSILPRRNIGFAGFWPFKHLVPGGIHLQRVTKKILSKKLIP
jgi:hypothetical protein